MLKKLLHNLKLPLLLSKAVDRIRGFKSGLSGLTQQATLGRFEAAQV